MEMFAKIWWVFGILTVLCYFFNPYIGLFSLFSIISLFITFCVFINIRVRNKKTIVKQGKIISEFNDKSQFIENNGAFERMVEKTAQMSKKYISIINYAWIIVFGMINVFVEIIIWLLASGKLGIKATYTTPFIIFSDSSIYNASLILLILGVLFSILTCISSFIRLRILSKEF